MKNWKKYISRAVFAFGLAVLSPCAFGAPASQEHGIVLSGEAKQDYIQKEMKALYHPAKNTAAKPWSPPNGWIYEKLTIGDVPVERIAPTKSATQRVILLLHGGGYMGGITDRYRALSIRQATYMDAAEVYNVDYRLAPAHVYPTALEDAEAVYRGLARTWNRPIKHYCFWGFFGRQPRPRACTPSKRTKASTARPAASALAMGRFRTQGRHITHGEF